MEFLNCYTIKNDIEEGICVDDFESIIVESPSTKSIRRATIEMVPAFDAVETVSTEDNLVFLHEATKRDKESDTHVIIAVDPEKWKLCYSVSNMTILDPCGVNGLVMLLVSKDLSNVLVKADDKHRSLQFKNKKLLIGPCARGTMLRDALVKRKLTIAANMLQDQYRLASPTDE